MRLCQWTPSAYRSCSQPTVRPLANHGGRRQMSLNHLHVCEAWLVRGQSGNLKGDGANYQYAVSFVEGYDA